MGFFSDWTGLWAGNGLIESGKKADTSLSCDWPIQFTLSISIQSHSISCAVRVGGAKGWKYWGENESRSFKVLLSSQAL